MSEQPKSRKQAVEKSFRDRIETGVPASFQPKDLADVKAHLTLALQERIKTYPTQGQVAAKWGITQSSVSHLSTGATERMSVQYILRLALEEGLIKSIEVAV